MASSLVFFFPSRISRVYESQFRFQRRIRSLASAKSTVVSSDSVGGNGGVPLIKEKKQSGVVVEKKKVSEELEVLWEDGYGSSSVKDYLDIAKDMIKSDGGPPRWFSPVECGRPVKDSPILLFLPGVDGVGLGLILHHKPLGR
ncbi:hypothetical protein GIB67_013285 [Kingdonia uniflora]|uniref:Uncharacterized protein n=1 Tax=Kingdonia uniflora TaxID=39325 RepID=A0A7J7N641_9MAGN|nr:hypothetical protein GIB67_013285 [Kingdonia uniflora]